jgi:hypothetical protein
VPRLSDKKQTNMASWFGADAVRVGAGRGSVQLRVKYFNDEPGVPPMLKTGPVEILMFTDGLNGIISQGHFPMPMAWGRPVDRPTPPVPHRQSPPPLVPKIKPNVTRIDVFDRNIDRTEMVLAVEYQYAKADRLAKMGLEFDSAEDANASRYFSSPLLDVGRRTRNVLFFPVALSPAAQNTKRDILPTDTVRVYLINPKGEKLYVFETPLNLVWRFPR